MTGKNNHYSVTIYVRPYKRQIIKYHPNLAVNGFEIVDNKLLNSVLGIIQDPGMDLYR